MTMQTGRITARYSSGRSIELLPSGIPSLDSTLGGGYPLGSIVLLIEDELGIYSDMFFKVYLSQGVANDDTIFIGSPFCGDSSFLTTLPALDGQTKNIRDDAKFEEPMTIAWRYGSTTASARDTNKLLALSDNFSFSKRIPSEVLARENMILYDPLALKEDEETLANIFEKIQALTEENSKKTAKFGQKSNLRIGLHHLGSALWRSNQMDIPHFLCKLRWLVAHFPASVLVTLPSDVFQSPKLVSRCRQICDVVYELVEIHQSENPLYSDYNGLLRLLKISPINSLAPLAEVTDDWAFKLIKKSLLVERLTLPPELDTSTQREQVKDLPLCGSLNKTLDF